MLRGVAALYLIVALARTNKAAPSDEGAAQTVDKGAFGANPKAALSSFGKEMKKQAENEQEGNAFLRSFHLTFASFFRFRHAYVSATFISIRALPNICV